MDLQHSVCSLLVAGPVFIGGLDDQLVFDMSDEQKSKSMQADLLSIVPMS